MLETPLAVDLTISQQGLEIASGSFAPTYEVSYPKFAQKVTPLAFAQVLSLQVRQ